ncbi:hypothetical protein, partial [Vibrio parahaemolyticus]|uniref:hypothetical protein n=1 Tax=Vibrio parahaemolyticus TaxID=670 RepID=UPI002361C99A
MKINTKSALDRFEKFFCLLMIVAPVWGIYFTYRLLNKYVDGISEEINVYYSYHDSLSMILSFAFLSSLLLFAYKIKSSKFNNTKLEKILERFLVKIEIVKDSVWLSRILFTSFYGMFYYILTSGIILMANDVNLFQEFNLVTMETNDYYQVVSNFIVTSLSISTLMTISLLLIKPKKGISHFLTGLIFIPLLLNGVIYGIAGNPFTTMFSDINNEMLLISSPISFVGKYGL